MVKRIAAGLVSVGLIGGAGAVAYDENGTATVTVGDHEVTLPVEKGGETYDCPASVEEKISPYDINAGRIDLTLRRVRRQEKAIEKQYRGRTAPKPIADEYKKLVRRDDRLVDRFNLAVDERNAILSTECTTE